MQRLFELFDHLRQGGLQFQFNVISKGNKRVGFNCRTSDRVTRQSWKKQNISRISGHVKSLSRGVTENLMLLRTKEIFLFKGWLETVFS